MSFQSIILGYKDKNTMEKGKKMAKSTEEKPRYETPMVVKLDEMEKASGAEPLCATGSAADACNSGAVATVGCSTGSTFAPD
jgi:hypothetical protein